MEKEKNIKTTKQTKKQKEVTKKNSCECKTLIFSWFNIYFH